MSNDLISKNEVLSILEKVFGDYGIAFGYSRRGFAEAVPKAIEAIPTAYDVEKVVEQLEELSDSVDDKIMENDGSEQYCDGFGDGIDEAIKIVKSGMRE